MTNSRNSAHLDEHRLGAAVCGGGLVHCSKDSVKNAATEAAKPAAPGETGEMQVRGTVSETHLTAGRSHTH